jgi:lipoyl(octanoyl) transferase
MIEFEQPSWPAYFLGCLPWPSFEVAQRRFTYEISGDSKHSSVIFCDHPTCITIGRAGSRSQVRLSDEGLRARGLALRWVGHGGGVMLHVPGQVACYPQLNLQALKLSPAEYVQTLADVLVQLLTSYELQPTVDPESMVIRVRDRAIATIGVSIRSGVSSFGFVLNVAPDLELFRELQVDGDTKPMTSLQRECQHLRSRVPTVRGQLLELLAKRFKLGPWSIFHHHPLYLPRYSAHARSAVAR